MATVTVDAKNVRPLPGYVGVELDAGEAMAVGKVVQIAGDGDAEMANATTASGVAGTLGIVTAGGLHDPDGDIASGERIFVVTRGRVYLGESANLDETKVYYVDTTDGVLTDVAPQYYRAVGTPISATVLDVNPVTTVPAS
jgi:hypothetical protein